MKIIIAGAGQVGFHIAQQLSSEGHDIIVVDSSPELVRQISDSLDVQAIVGHASHPDTLDRAGAADVDMLMAVTHLDEVNMVACQVAHSMFSVPLKIARIREQSYLQPIWADLFSRDHMPIDVIISPEIEVARAITRCLQVPGSFDTVSLVGGKVQMLGVHCGDECPVINTPLRQLTELFPDLEIFVVGVMRDGVGFVPKPADQLQEGDQVYFVVKTQNIGRAMRVFGVENTEVRRVVIAGGGHIGAFLAEMIEKEFSGISARIVESSYARAHEVADLLEETVVIHGDVIDPDILSEARVKESEAIIAVTNDDETNILASLLAKRIGTKSAIALVNNQTYAPLISSLGIDVAISPRAITASTILQHVRRGRISSVHSLGADFGELIEGEVSESSVLSGKRIEEAELPEGILIGAVVRGDQVILPRGNTLIQPNDQIVLFAASEAVKAVEKLFAVRLEFF